MKRITRVGIVSIFILLSLFATQASAESGGAGGLLYGVQMPGWNPSFLPQIVNPSQLIYFGGFGYGVTNEGAITGGFGFVMYNGNLPNSGTTSSAVTQDFIGGFGGIIGGQRLLQTSIVDIDFITKVGFGGYASTIMGGLAIYGEVSLSLGVSVLPWMQITAYLGYNVIVALLPPDFTNGLFYAPTLGFSVSWGKF